MLFYIKHYALFAGVLPIGGFWVA